MDTLNERNHKRHVFDNDWKSTHVNLFLPGLHLPFECLHLCGETDRLRRVGRIDRLSFQVRARLLDVRVEHRHLVTQHVAEATQHVFVPGVIFQRDLGLHLAKLYNNGANLLVGLRRVKCLPPLPLTTKCEFLLRDNPFIIRRHTFLSLKTNKRVNF